MTYSLPSIRTLPRDFGLGHGAGLDQVVEGDHFGLDEAALEVGVDHAGGLRGGVALVDGPGPRFLGPGRQVGLQAEGVEADAGQLVQAGLVLAVHLQHFAGFFLVQFHEVGFELGVEEDGSPPGPPGRAVPPAFPGCPGCPRPR